MVLVVGQPVLNHWLQTLTAWLFTVPPDLEENPDDFFIAGLVDFSLLRRRFASRSSLSAQQFDGLLAFVVGDLTELRDQLRFGLFSRVSPIAISHLF